MGLARVEWAELLFHEASDVTAAPQPSSELTAQVQASILLGIYHELRHGHDLVAANTRALNEHRAAMIAAGHAYDAGELSLAGSAGQLPPAREPFD